MDDREVIQTLRGQISNLFALFTLSMMFFDRVEDDEILALAVSAVPAFGSFGAEAYLDRRDLPQNGTPPPELKAQLNALAGTDGGVRVPGATWAWAYPLHAVGGHAGYLVITALATPTTDELFLVQTLAQLAGAALSSAATYRSEVAMSAELRERNTQLAALNLELTAVVDDLGRRTRLHESFMNVVASGGAAPEIAIALHEVTGLAVVIEDKFGNVLGSAGGERPMPRRRMSAHDRTELLNRVQRHRRPMRHGDRVLALAQPRNEVLGVLVLIDPERRAGQFEIFALEDAGVVLAMELAHQRSLAEAELRLRRDLVDDLLTGADDESALARSAALNHDLRLPHQVVVVSWPGTDDTEKIIQAVDQATTRITQARALLTRRGGNVVLVAPAREHDDTAHDWGELHRLLSAALPARAGAIGVGRLYRRPSELPRSYAEALRGLAVRRRSADHIGVTTFEQLGFYRILGTEESHREMVEFIREWLGPLIDYDTRHRYDLVNTLWQYYECGGNYDATAHALLIHRSTLRYRLRRIRELTGHDLGVADTRLNLHIATRAWQILNGAT
ncbi:transcriptional regulator, CdaR [Pseudonocardia dioxanivorans CB1190]|uniref:Transcriptional regulator, CdaR n=1 Tax=Pseudonocardia dioxanivorans (strain ATCC 55486 / DSM 44775 / JCM 13855 / CB1190) TaxID=675635 RepID=F4CZA2_PSEUX|nr:helix-turn-helix domain-containing protein [Pseudonocardia dioxanivorans]AEA25633.1 transcriptional regulator, CdaR [Pseudonocardia dioxanivorans CB1190]